MTSFFFLLAMRITSLFTFEQKNNTRNSVHIEMIAVEGGTFQMGDNQGRYDEKPAHTVVVNSFSIGKFEVTQEQWSEIMGYNPSYFKCNNCPVEQVSRDEILFFLEKINTQTGKTYRLPTEAEWEFAARGGNLSKGYKYSGSDDVKTVAWMSKNAHHKSHPIGEKPPNELGIYDMSGNVWEFCNDWYKGYPNNNEIEDLTNIAPIIRGGAWGNNAKYSRMTIRYAFESSRKRNAGVGFRLAL